MSHEAFCYNSSWLYIWIWMVDVAEFVNRPLFFFVSIFCSCSSFNCSFIKIHGSRSAAHSAPKADLLNFKFSS